MLWLLCCLPVVTGCIREEEYANDPVGNFEQLWKIIDERYCFLEEKGIDWDAVHDKYGKLVKPGISDDDLFDILSQMSTSPPPVVFHITMPGIKDILGTIERISYTITIWEVPVPVIVHLPV